MKIISFTKMAATGNDFIVIDNRKKSLPGNKKKLIQDLCAFHTGIGADGVLLLEKSHKASFKMRIFNPDGSEPDMCGNGARCICLWAWKKKIVSRNFTMETGAGLLKGKILPLNKVKVQLTKPKDLKLNLQVPIKGEKHKIHCINTGVPHAIIFSRNVEKEKVFDLGKAVRWHKTFQPHGTNVDFVEITAKNRILVRTYERGVENETLACGTGVSASAIISALACGLKPPIKAKAKSGDILEIDFEIINNKVGNVTLTGPARIVFEGKYTPTPIKKSMQINL